MSTKQTEALKLALEDLLLVWKDRPSITAIREALAEQTYPDNFIHALMYDVAKRDSEAQQAYEDAFINGTGVMLGDKRIDPASIYKQPEQEPVAMYEDWYNPKSCGHCGMVGGHIKTCRHYTTPPQRKPLTQDLDAPLTLNGVALYPRQQPLTDEEIEFIYADTGYNDIQMFARAIEAAHGIKGDA